MKLGLTKKSLLLFLIFIYIVPIIISIVMLFQWNANNGILMFSVIGIIWIFAIVISYFCIKEVKNNPYPFSYLLDYDTLIKYMNEEEKFSFDNQLEAGFHYYLYQNEKKIEVQAWHYIFSDIEEEKNKGNRYYWDNEEFSSLDSLIENKIKKFDGYILVELIDSDNVMLNDFKKNHKELDVAKYIENSKIK